MIEKMKDNMANLPESIAKQPINTESNSKEWGESALPLVRKVFAELKPNGVLFKRDDGQLIICLIKEGKFDWDNVLALNMKEIKDKHDDLMANPFEFVFIRFNETQFTTMNQKTTIPNYTFSKLFDEGKLIETIKVDYEQQYGPL